MTVEIISRSISRKVWNQARNKCVIPGSAIGLTTDCTLPGPVKKFIYQDTIIMRLVLYTWKNNNQEKVWLGELTIST